jgi:dTDP-4-dehydrorhamnose reductase
MRGTWPCTQAYHGTVGSVLVVGASGYVGRAVAKALELQGATVVGVGRDGLAPAMAAIGPEDAVINCAGALGAAEAELRAANVELAALVAAGAREHEAALVHLSSLAVFDGIPFGDLLPGTAPVPATPYGRSKADGEREVRRAHASATIVRPSKVFGGADPRQRLHQLVGHVRSGRPLPVPRHRPLWANFISVHALARIAADAALRPAGPATVHATNTVSWPTFVEILEAETGTQARRLPAPAVGVVGALVRGLRRVPPERRPRRAERLLELWDEQEFVDTEARLGRADLEAGVAELVERCP